MASPQKVSKNIQDKDYDPTLILGDANMPLDLTWAKNFLTYAWGIPQPSNLAYADRLFKYRGIDSGVFDVNELKQYFDPSPNIPMEQKADLMRTDWRPSPLIHSLNQIVQKNIENIPIELTVQGTDKLSIDKKAEAKLRIQTRKAFLEIVNVIKSATNDMPVGEDTNIENLVNETEDVDESLNIIDEIKKEAVTNWDFSMLNEVGALKDGVEISHEEMIDYYFKNCKFKDNLSYKIISDFMKINAFSYRFFTNAINGLPEVTYMDLAYVRTSNFKKRDGGDMDWWYYTTTVTWAQYMQMIGGKQTPEKNKEIYEKNRLYFYANDRDFPQWQENNTFTYPMLQANIRLGYFEAKKHVYDSSTKKYYDVIRKFYYLPLGISDMAEEYILDLGNLQDMHRYGTNLQLADFSLVIYRDTEKQSFYDVQQGDYLRLNALYNDYLNTLSAYIPESTSFVKESIEKLADEVFAEEEAYMKEHGLDTTQLSLVKIRENIIRNYVFTGKGIFSMFTGDLGETPLPKPTFIMDNKILLNCTQLLQQMFMVFSHMKMSLGINDNRLANDPKPRTTQKGVESATEASYFSTQNLEDAYQFALSSFGNRMLYYDQNVITEFDSKRNPTTERAKEMKAIIGTKGTTWLEVYKDMPYQRCILKVTNLPSDQDRAQLMAITANYEQMGKVPSGTLLVAQEIKNFKLAKLYVVMSIKRQDRQMLENQIEMMKAQGEQQQQAIEQNMALQAKVKEQDASLEGRLLSLENALKTQGQLDVKEATKNSRIEEEDNRAKNDMQLKVAEKELETF